jgi:hypothetical protein
MFGWRIHVLRLYNDRTNSQAAVRGFKASKSVVVNSELGLSEIIDLMEEEQENSPTVIQYLWSSTSVSTAARLR